jgi:hypothetical protein
MAISFQSDEDVLRNLVSDKRTHLEEECVAAQCCDMTKRGKKAWTKWRRLVSEQARSGQTITAFCRERALCSPYLFVWKKRLRKLLAHDGVRTAPDLKAMMGRVARYGAATLARRLRNKRLTYIAIRYT